MRREAIKEAEEKRRLKHKKMEEEREALRQGIREKVFEEYFFYTLGITYYDLVNHLNDSNIRLCLVQNRKTRRLRGGRGR